MGNQLIPRGDPQSNLAESNRVHLDGAVVRVENPDGSPIIGPDGSPREFTSLATGFNDPQNNNTPGYGTVGLVVFDAPTKAAILPSLLTRGTSRTVLVTVKVFGKSIGGVDVESGEFPFPMQVCRGCLVDYSDGYDSTSKTQPRNCDKPAETTAAASTSGPCLIGQDVSNLLPELPRADQSRYLRSQRALRRFGVERRSAAAARLRAPLALREP